MTLENLIINISVDDFLTKEKSFFHRKLNSIIVVKNALPKIKIRKIARRILRTKKHYVKILVGKVTTTITKNSNYLYCPV